MRFEFATAQRIVFGSGSARELGPIAAGLGRRALLAVGTGHDRVEPVLALLGDAGVATVTVQVKGEPTTDSVRTACQVARDAVCDLVIGFGGGSSIDTAKAVAALLANGGDPLDYIEVVGRGKELSEPGLPVIAIPTTAGAGAEVTRNAVLLSPGHGIKASLRSPTMLPRVALIDPELTLSLPPQVTASTGLDALTQLIEPFTSGRANPMTDSFCREGMARAARSLRRAYEHPDDLPAREDMSLASLLGGLSLANAGLGAAHGFAGVIGGAFHAPHGAVCAALLPEVMSTNVAALSARQPGSPSLARYDEIATIITGNLQARAAEGVRWVQDLVRDLHIPPLGAYGVTEEHVADVVLKTAVASSTKANPIVLTQEELASILRAAL